jgi:hypothetical protein
MRIKVLAAPNAGMANASHHVCVRKLTMSQILGAFDAEVSEMLGFYRDAAMQADQQNTTVSSHATKYAPASAQRAPARAARCRIGCSFDVSANRWQLLVATVDRRRHAR